MERRKENFKPLRELVGMSQAHLAKELGIDPRSVRRWEDVHKKGYTPMAAAWNILEEKQKAQMAACDAAISMVERYEENGIVSDTVTLTYWPNAIEYAGRHPEEDPANWQMANANTRLVAHQLMRMGYNVQFGWPGLKIKIGEQWKGEGWYTVREWEEAANDWKSPVAPAPVWFEHLYDFEKAFEAQEDGIEYNVGFNGSFSLAERSDGLWTDIGLTAEPLEDSKTYNIRLDDGRLVELTETGRIVITKGLERCRVFRCAADDCLYVFSDGKWSQWEGEKPKTDL